MDAPRFDSLTRRLSLGLNRRSLGLLLALSLPPQIPLSAAAAKKKKACPPCKKRKNGKCKGTLPDGTGCAGGTCQRGSCVAAVLGSVAPDPCASCSGDQVCIGGACVVPACGAGGPCLVFLSSILYDGDLDGLSGADAKCQTLATAVGLPGIYKAWLSDNTSSPISRFVPATGPYRLVNGTTVAANWTDLTDGALSAPINVTETGGGVGADPATWTNTRVTGNTNSANFHCANWSTNAAASKGNAGSANSSQQFWSDSGPANCDVFFHLYCFQQS